MTPTLVAHAVLNAHMKFLGTRKEYHKWLQHSFKKVVVRVNQKEFDAIAELEDVFIGSENNTLEGKPSCIVVCPRENNPNVLRFAKLWEPKKATDGVNEA